MKSVMRMDFGNCHAYGKPGYATVGRVYRSPHLLWLDYELREVWRPGPGDPLLLSFVEGRRGELCLGLPPGRYSLDFSFHDPLEDHGPFDLAVASGDGRAPRGAGEERTLLSGVVVPRGVVVVERVEVDHPQ